MIHFCQIAYAPMPYSSSYQDRIVKITSIFRDSITFPPSAECLISSSPFLDTCVSVTFAA